MRLIDADAIPFRDELKRLSVLDHDKYITARTLEYMLEHAPTVDAVPVIRCKDCKWYGRADKRRFYRGMDCLNKRIDTIVPDKDYCSKAERKEE